jgi:pectate lyase
MFFLSLMLLAAPLSGDLVNLSCRSLTQAGDGALIMGFVIDGAEAEQILIRAAGPSLEDFGVEGALARVKLELYAGGVLLAENMGWDQQANAEEIELVAQRVGAFAFAPGSGDAALLVELPPGAYTAIATPAPGEESSGETLVEAYDGWIDNRVRLVNLSVRSRVQQDAEHLIMGFVVNGEGNRVLTRGIGPGLLDYGVPDALADPAIEVFNTESLRAQGYDWWTHVDSYEIASRSRTVGAFPLQQGSADAAAILRPGAGVHNALITAEDGGEGATLAEIYDLRAMTPLPPVEVFDLVGFARLASAELAEFTGGGVPSMDYDPASGIGNYWRIEADDVAATGFAESFRSALAGDQPLVVEINTTLDLSVVGQPDTVPNRTAVAHPLLIPEGQDFGYIGKLNIGSNKTIYSATGTGVLKRGSLSLEGSRNVMIRNLHFRELWEWDDETNGDYDRNAWDYITVLSRTDGDAVLERACHIWIDHCDFANAYDGHVDVVLGADLVTVSWSRFGGGYADDAADWVQAQMAHLEEQGDAFDYYERVRRNYSAAEVLAQSRPHFKSSLVGNGSSATNEAQDRGYLNVTYHHNWYHATQDRMPRVRYGNAHVFNLWADDSPLDQVARVQRDGVKGTAEAAVLVENTTFVDVDRPLNNRLFPEERGRVSVRGSVNLDRATGLDIGFDDDVLTDPEAFRWNSVAPETGLGDWPEPDSAALPAGYFPTGATAADYLHPADYLEIRLDETGVVVPRHAEDEAILRRWLQSPTPSAM